jgi:hypothetical protein
MGIENFIQDNEGSPRKPSESAPHFEREFVSSLDGGRYELERRDHLYKIFHDPKFRGHLLEHFNFNLDDKELDELAEIAKICEKRGWVENLGLNTEDRERAFNSLLERGKEGELEKAA